jgi:hypothetical protein
MPASEARKILGTPTQAADDQDFYIVSENETVQVCYDGSKNVHAISVDYTGEGSGAPSYKDVVGEDVTVRQDGSIWRMLRFEKLGFWVSYNRTAGSPATITVTLQKIVGTARAN